MVALALQNANKCNEGQTEILQKKYIYQHKKQPTCKKILAIVSVAFHISKRHTKDNVSITL